MFREAAKGFVANSSTRPGSSAFETTDMGMTDVTQLALSGEESDGDDDEGDGEERKEEEEEEAPEEADGEDDAYEREVKEFEKFRKKQAKTARDMSIEFGNTENLVRTRLKETAHFVKDIESKPELKNFVSQELKTVRHNSF